jgi:hypothetical protein
MLLLPIHYLHRSRNSMFHLERRGRKLDYDEGYVIDEGADGFQYKDCKYYMYSRNCLLIKGTFTPKMSCGYVVKCGNGTDI